MTPHYCSQGQCCVDVERERRQVGSKECDWWRERQVLQCERTTWKEKGGIEGYGTWGSLTQTYVTFMYEFSIK